MADEKKPAENKGLTPEMWRQIKHLDKRKMEQYIKNIYGAGYDQGYKAGLEAAKKGER